MPPAASAAPPESEPAACSARGKDFRDLADLLPLTVFEVDCRGQFTFVNRFGLDFSGYSAADLEQGINIVQVVLSPPDVSLVENFRRQLAGAPDSQTHYSLLTRDGQTKPVTVHTNVIVEAEEVVGLRGVVVDLTEQKRSEEAFARAERLEAAGRIAGQVAHDFNNLLAPVLAYPQLIREKLEPNHPAVRYLDDIEAATRQLAEISQQLLTLARRGHYELSPLDINDVVRGVVALSREHPQDLTIELRLAEGLNAVLGGEAQLGRVILNLVNNARDAMHDSGVLTIETSLAEIQDHLGVLGRIPAGRYVVVKVGDTGPGIPPANLRRIFEPFFSTKKADRCRGSGLGLSTAYAVLHDHGSYLDVETKLGSGTTFTVLFPECDLQPIPQGSAPLVGGHEQLLVVDDEPMQRQVARHLLERLGYQVNLALSGEQAVSMVASGLLPDLAILDMSLGSGMDGAETYRQLLALVPGLRAIVLSAYAETDRVNVALGLGAGRFVRKPIDIATIASVVREELDR
jgi:two-component system, cell cycle sensor histidine kinase and response regulator CckA